MVHKLEKLKSISVLNFIKLNFFSKQVHREKGVYIIPYKNAVIDLSSDARIILKNNNVHIGSHKLRGSKAETYLRMEGKSQWNASNGATLCYNSTIEIKDGGILTSGYFFMNSGSVVLCSRDIEIGNDVWMGRDNTIYDNDHHQLLDEQGNVRNLIKPVKIGDKVWLTNHVSVLKGVNIGEGAVIAPYSVIRVDVKSGAMVGNPSNQTVFNENIIWSPDLVK